jgi:hypothetical protein
MTEAEWLECLEPEKMLLHVRDRASDRKMRLFAIACCRRVWDRLTDPRSQEAVAFGERFAEVGVARRRGRPAVEKAARKAWEEADEARRRSSRLEEQVTRLIDVNAFHAASATLEGNGWFAAYLASGFTANVVAWEKLRDRHGGRAAWDPAAKEMEQRQQVPLLRDIFGNPFRPPAPVPAAILAWGNGAVPKVAGAIYEEAAFDRLPILADALEDAGCDNADLLDHCRGPGVHARGCWAVDALLGRK